MGDNDVTNSKGPTSSSTAAVIGQTSSLPLQLTPPCSHFEKPEKFSGYYFATWQQKMLFYLTQLQLAKFLKEVPPVVSEDGVDAATTFNAIEACNHSNFLCSNYILNGLSDTLYKVYKVKTTSKELWESLDHKYKIEDAGSKKFLVARFLNFVMVDSKPLMSQVEALQLIINELDANGMLLVEPFQVAAIVEKLPPGWKEFKSYIKHKKKEMTVEQLVVRLRIEVDNRAVEKRLSKTVIPNAAKVNVVEVKNNFKKGKQHNVGSKLGPKGGVSKK